MTMMDAVYAAKTADPNGLKMRTRSKIAAERTSLLDGTRYAHFQDKLQDLCL